ncbi:MAG: radical SAM protein, partial [Candidatus Methylomirabilis sp.]|nr:radical SAM protein [Deltaproteobacteria bacterium]
VGMSNLGYQAIYRILNETPHALAERVFLPGPGEGAPRAEESGRPLADFDVVAFSVSFEPDYLNLLRILGGAGVPLASRDRGEDDPLVLAGGVACFLNPEPVAEFVDVFALGEGEEIAREIAATLAATKGRLKRERLRELARIRGLYVPEFLDVAYNEDGTIAAVRSTIDQPPTVPRVQLSRLGDEPTSSVVLTDDTEFGGMYLTGVNRGCPQGCRFCTAGFIYLPMRQRSVETLAKEVDKAVASGKRIGFVGTALADYRPLKQLWREAIARGAEASPSSFRIECVDEEVASLFHEAGMQTATVAPDAAGERMRRIIRKEMTRPQLLRTIRTLRAGGTPNLKLYYIVGLPWETPADLREMVDEIRAARDAFVDASRPFGRIGTFTVSLNCFVPKPFTPLQWAPMEDPRSLERKLRSIKKEIGRIGGVTLHHEQPREALLQTVLSVGDRRTAAVLRAAYENGGDWRKAFEASPLPFEWYAYREKGEREILPWDFIIGT